MLILQGDLDRQIPPDSIDLLETMARTRKKNSTAVSKIAGVNHLLVPATTGETDEYGTLTDRKVSSAVGDAITQWLTKTLARGR
jgi:hypothetical protein